MGAPIRQAFSVKSVKQEIDSRLYGKSSSSTADVVRSMTPFRTRAADRCVHTALAASSAARPKASDRFSELRFDVPTKFENGGGAVLSKSPAWRILRCGSYGDQIGQQEATPICFFHKSGTHPASS